MIDVERRVGTLTPEREKELMKEHEKALRGELPDAAVYDKCSCDMYAEGGELVSLTIPSFNNMSIAGHPIRELKHVHKPLKLDFDIDGKPVHWREMVEVPPRGTGLETGRAGERRAGKPRTEEERRLRHWGSDR